MAARLDEKLANFPHAMHNVKSWLHMILGGLIIAIVGLGVYLWVVTCAGFVVVLVEVYVWFQRRTPKVRRSSPPTLHAAHTPPLVTEQQQQQHQSHYVI